MNVALAPVGRQQFLDASGVPLAGGSVATFAAGTSVPLATYIDGLGVSANTNPVILDPGGFASIWLTQALYKFVVSDQFGVVQWTQDNISSVSQAEIGGSSTFASLNVTGSETVGGNLTVDGTITAATLATTGSAAIAGSLTATSVTTTGAVNAGTSVNAVTAAISGNETVGGTLGVTGTATVGDLVVNGVEISALITSLIPVVASVAGTLIISNIFTQGNWVIFEFGGTSGTKITLAFGAGSGLVNGAVIPLPNGAVASQMIAHASIQAVAATTGNQLSQFACSVTGGAISITASDNSGHNFTPTASWCAMCWVTGVA